MDGFTKTRSWRNKGNCGHEEYHAYPFLGMQFDYEQNNILWMWQPKWAFSEIPLLHSMAAWPSSPLWLWNLSRLLLEAEQFLLTTDLWMSPVWVLCKLQLDCMPVTLPLSWDTSQGLRFLTWDRDSSSPKAKRPLIHNRSSVNCWYLAKLILMKPMWLIPLDMNHCPALGLRLDWATPNIPEEFKKQGNLVTQQEGLLFPFMSWISVYIILNWF